MDAATIRQFFPNASKSLLAANDDHRAPSRAEPQPAVRNEPVAAARGKAAHAGRVLVRVASFRRRLLDPDNLCPKYFIDACRYAGLIRDDTAEAIEFSCGQIKVKTKAEEKTVITITTTEP